MCGIHGICRLDGGPALREHLSLMGDVTVHRGPDDEGSYADGPCAIGMRRLSIIDLAGGHQPLTNAEGTLWLVANGEDRKSTRLNSSHVAISYAVFCLKKKKK